MRKEVLDKIRNIEEERLYALVGYCFLLCVVPLLFKKDSDFAVFHGRQGLALFLCEMVIFIVSILLPWIMKPFLFVFAVFSLWGMIKALQGERFKLPLIYAFSERVVL
ncbi:MAG: hypothetical protein HQL21_07905 [Candidatus Omnitrophica bacterium]|nr:hypothetical protein [Candidatus Omnitrophota bacterium]